MRRFLSALLFLSLSAGSLLADDQVKDVQTQLKAQGFYFGEVDGLAGKDFTAAVRRYQIRNGLDVTGEVNAQVLQSLGIGGGAVAANPPAPTPQVAPEPVESGPAAPAARSPVRPPVNLRRDESVAESDRRALQQEPMPPAAPAPQGGFVPPTRRPAQPPEDPSVQPSAQYRDIFAGTPYANAPRPVQEETFLRAERLLESRGLLDRRAGAGAPSPALADALVAYQRGARLPATGRLDLETLSAMHLLPGRGDGNPGVAPLRRGEVPPPRAYRGIWVQ